MQKNVVKKGLALAIIILFISVSFQPMIAEKTQSVEKESDKSNVDFEQAKEYLFQTLVDISNNPDVKGLLKQSNQKLFTSDYDYKSKFSQIFLKKPGLFLSILFTKPKITYEYLNKSYNKGIECVNIVDENRALEMVDSIDISSPDILNELKNILMNNKELSNRIATLEMMNSDLKSDSLLKFYPIICVILFIITIPYLIYFSIVNYIFDHINPNIEAFWLLSLTLLFICVFFLAQFGCIKS